MVSASWSVECECANAYTYIIYNTIDQDIFAGKIFCLLNFRVV